MKKVILFKVIGHDCGSYDCCNPDPAIFPVSEYIEIEDTEYEALEFFVKQNAHKYFMLNALEKGNSKDQYESVFSLIEKGKTLLEKEKEREANIAKREANKKANAEKNALKLKQKKMLQLQKELEELQKQESKQ